MLQLLVWLVTTWLSLICGGLGGEHGFSDTAQNACCIIYLKLRDVRTGGGVCLIWCLHMNTRFTDLQRLLINRLIGTMSKALSMLVCYCMEVSSVQQQFFLKCKAIVQLAVEQWAKCRALTALISSVC